jgi:hypothetical protein
LDCERALRQFAFRRRPVLVDLEKHVGEGIVALRSAGSSLIAASVA